MYEIIEMFYFVMSCNQSNKRLRHHEKFQVIC